MKSFFALIAATLGIASAQVQPVTVSNPLEVGLPLVSIGDKVGWNLGTEDYRLRVRQNTNSSIELFSPDLNRNDYANQRNQSIYLGDELYGKNATLETTFALNGLFERSFKESTNHSYVQVFSGSLAAGFYPLLIQSKGNGKNAFQIRASNGVDVQASQFTVNARGQFNQAQLVANLTVEPEAIGKTIRLENYDADGETEMRLGLQTPQGTRPLPSSPDTNWAGLDILVTPELVGTWKIYATVLPSTKQFSNSVAFRFRLEGLPLFAQIPGFTTPPSTLQAAPKPAILELNAFAEVCGQRVPISSTVQIGTQVFNVPNRLELPARSYQLEPQSLGGAVSPEAQNIVLESGQSRQITLLYRPQLNLSLEPSEAPTPATLLARVSTAFAQALPVRLRINPNEPGVLPQRFIGEVSAAKPLEWQILANKPGVLGVELEGCELRAQSRILVPSITPKVLIPAKLELEKTVQKANLKIGELAEFQITVRNTGEQPSAVRLSDVLPQGLVGRNLDETFTLQGKSQRRFSVYARATQAGEFTNIARLTGNNQTLSASASVQVEAKPVPQVVAPLPSKLVLEKTVTPQIAQIGQAVRFRIRVQNTGAQFVSSIQLQDLLPEGLEGENLEAVFDLAPRSERSFYIIAKATKAGEFTNTATLQGNNQNLSSQASIVVQAAIPPTPIIPATPAQLELEKAVNNPEVRLGSRVEFVLTVRNTGGSAATARLEDLLPDGLSGKDLVQDIVLRPFSQRSFVISVLATKAGEFINTATLTGNNQSLSASARVVVTAPSTSPAKLELEKTVQPERVRLGESVRFALVVRNTGGSATTVNLKDILPEGLVGQNLERRFDLPANSSRTFFVIARTNQLGSIVNTATLSDSSNSLSASATVQVDPVIQSPRPTPPTSADALIRKWFSPSRLALGQLGAFHLAVTNLGSQLLNNIEVIDNVPNELELQSIPEECSFETSSRVLRCQIAQLEVGESRLLRLTFFTTVSQTIVNTATVRVVENESNLENNSDSATLIVHPAPAQLTLEKSVDRSEAQSGTALEYRIRVGNIGGQTATNVRLQDLLPSGVSGDNLETSFDLAAGEEREFIVPARLIAVQGQVKNTAQVFWNGRILRSSASTIVQPRIDLRLSKSVSPSRVQLGGTVEYTLRLENIGNLKASNVRLTDPLPQGIVATRVSSSKAFCRLQEGLRCDFGTLQRGEVVTVTLMATANRVGTIVNSAEVSAAETESDPSNNRASATLEVLAPPPPPAVLEVVSEALVCGSRQPISNMRFMLGGQTYTTPARLELPGGEVQIVPEAVRGAKAAPAQLARLESGKTLRVMLEYQPEVRLVVSGGLQLKVGERGSISATANSDFPVALNLKLGLSLPAALEATGVTQTSGNTPLTLTVPVRAIQPLESGSVTATLEGCDLRATQNVRVQANPLPAQSRQSQIRVLAQFNPVPDATHYVVSDVLPAGSGYQIGSSRAVRFANAAAAPVSTTFTDQDQGSQIPDPIVQNNRLYWVIPAALWQQTINASRSGGSADTWFGATYRVSHTDPIIVPNNPSLWAVSSSRNLNARQVADSSLLGQRTNGGQVRLLLGEDVLLEPLLRPTQSSVVVTQNPVAKIEFALERQSNDPADRAVLVVRTLDAQNQRTGVASLVTLELNVEPLTEDAEPLLSGYQVKLENGEARVSLMLGGSETAPAPLEVRVEGRIGSVSSSQNFQVSQLGLGATNPLAPQAAPVTDSQRPILAVGIASAQFNLSDFSALGGLRAFVRGSVGDGWVLTGAINIQAKYDTALSVAGNLLPPSNPYERFPLFGDASLQGSDVRSNDSFFLRLENGSSFVMYGQFNPNFVGLLTNYSPTFNGFNGVYRAEDISISGFAASVPFAKQRQSLPADGTSFYRLGTAIEPNSERLVVAVYDRNNPSIKLEEKVLVRLEDYSIDEISGNILLVRPLLRQTANGNLQVLEVEYTVAGEIAPRSWRFGAQASLRVASGLTLAFTALQFQTDPSAVRQFGVGLAYQNGGLQLALEGSLSNGSLGVAAQASYTSQDFQTQWRYQDTFEGYISPSSNAAMQGRSLSGAAIIGNPNAFSLNFNLEHSQNYQLGNSSTTLAALAKQNFGSWNAFAGLGLLWSHLPTLPAPRSFGIYAALGADLKLDALEFGITQRVPLYTTTSPSTAYGDTTLRIGYRLTEQLKLQFSDTITYAPNGLEHSLGFGVQGAFSNSELLRFFGVADTLEPATFGSTNLAIGYNLETVTGNAGRARVGLDTNIPLSSTLSAQASAEATWDGTFAGALGLGLRLDQSDLQASTRFQLGFTPIGTKQVYSAGLIWKPDPTFTISPSLEYTVLPNFISQNGQDIRDGGRYSVAFAWRLERWSILSNHSGRFGIAAPSGDSLQGEVQFGYQGSEHLFVRFGGAYRLELNPSVLTTQLNAGTTWFITNEFGVGASAVWLWQPSTETQRLAFGIEASYRFTDGLIGTVGWNVIGFNGIGGFSALPGLYIRLDWIFALP